MMSTMRQKAKDLNIPELCRLESTGSLQADIPALSEIGARNLSVAEPSKRTWISRSPLNLCCTRKISGVLEGFGHTVCELGHG